MHSNSYLHLARDEQGFTLIELLVAMAISVVVIAALVTILEFSLHQETQITDKAQANQIGRTAMNEITDELHSSCTGSFGSSAIQAPETTPITPLESSGQKNLWFISAYGDETSGNAVLEHVTEHDISWKAEKTSNTGAELGTLTDYEFAGTRNETASNWEFPALSKANAKARVLAQNVIPPQSSAIFQYYKYNNTSTSATFGQLEELGTSQLPLSTAAAKNVAKVTISFAQAPSDGDTRTGRTASFSDSVVLRFESASTETEAVNSPCE